MVPPVEAVIVVLAMVRPALPVASMRPALLAACVPVMVSDAAVPVASISPPTAFASVRKASPIAPEPAIVVWLVRVAAVPLLTMALAAESPSAMRPVPLAVVLPAMTRLPLALSAIVPVLVIVPLSVSEVPSVTATVPLLVVPLSVFAPLTVSMTPPAELCSVLLERVAPAR